MALLYVARHGETQWNRAGRYQGRLESRLTDRGEAQAAALAGALAHRGVARVFSSPLGRCLQTATPLTLALGLPLEVDDRLIEIGHGAWEGRLRAEIEADDTALFTRWKDRPETVSFPGGESLDDVLARWRTFVGALDGKNDVAVVTHDAIVRLAVLDASGRGPAQFWVPSVGNGAFAALEFDGGTARVVEDCVSDHLGSLSVDTSLQAL